MYAYIKGTLEEKAKDSIVIETSGIGYKIYVSENTMSKLGELGEKVKIYTHYHVREDNISLYGFNSNEELKMFELLLQVSGVGAKTAIAMLSNITPSKFALAIISNDLKTLTKIPGIGNKSAQRMVLELKDKLKTETAIDQNEETDIETDNSESLNEATQALQILGYNKNEITKVFDKFETKKLSTEEIIKNALKLLAR
ncbi:MAG: Holliday junction branch migration protein RuvA [Clostridia bacterium]|nr:Holliday junction branch migration protein RuvA [Clostridia bacterium]